MRYSITLDSRIGTRETNQDRVGYSENQNGVFMVVADGLGGYAGGDLAAQTVVDSLIRSFDEQGESIIADPPAFIVLSINYAHSLVTKEARLRGFNATEPRTTCVACLVQNGYAYWGHVGDSRLYLFSGDELLTRTIDHSTTDHMHQDGAVDEQFQRLGNGQLFRCIGGTRRPVVTLGAETHLSTDDTILLCSDGVWRAFKEKRLAKAIADDSIEDSLDLLMSHARRFFRNDCDNMTALMFRWEDEPSKAQPLLPASSPAPNAERLWHNVMERPQTSPSTNTQGADLHEEFNSVIEEIESLVNELDTSHELKRRKRKSGG